MLSKSQIKLIKSLSQKKFRNKHKLFVVEGLKGVKEFLDSDFKLVSLYFTEEQFEVADRFLNKIDQKDLKKISFLKTPQNALAVFEIPRNEENQSKGLTLVLDGIRDPGNLGTIIRLCDWFGIENLICSPDTVDCFNPKVVQASMGSLTRVSISYNDLLPFLKKNSHMPVFGTMLDGENIYSAKLPEEAFLVMGNEANGISQEIQNLISKKITIPQFGNIRETESLNVATATSIILSEFRRNSAIEK
ncbi:RNA methyltransferase [Gramella sp. MAR_2010_147]|uniref:TrmH family RNA methyltransferase n=1 Tax=Gramella sp. MAR_2010_147 TaxID=1250205 RepID=UPI000879A0ED|nr:RNA methyltransferase [Gramella sp. MAR_2010_147]SDS08276.1 RNA methyltransferase, TrmH family [Gramella sp. MAR_2010_147]